MDYQKAASLKKTGLVSLIAKNKFEKGQGLGSSIGNAISDKFKARATRAQEMMDPLNWVSKLVGKGTFGRVATTVAGRAFGRSDETIGYFGGYKRKSNKNSSVNPRFTKIGPGPIRPLKLGDSGADILGKMYNFMRKNADSDRERDEIATTFRQEKLDNEERRHHELVEAIKKYTGKKGGKPKEEKDNSLLKGLLGAALLAAALAKMKNLANSLLKSASKMIARVVASAAKMIAKAVATGIKSLYALAKTLAKTLKSVGKFGAEAIEKGVGKILGKEVGKETAKTVVKSAEKSVAKFSEKELAQLAKAGLKTNVAGRVIEKATGKFVSKEITQEALKTAVKKGIIKKGLGFAVKKIPLVGLGLAAFFAAKRAAAGDTNGALGELGSGGASMIPGVGTVASVAADVALMARDIYNDIYGNPEGKTPEEKYPFDNDVAKPEFKKRKDEIIDAIMSELGTAPTDNTNNNTWVDPESMPFAYMADAVKKPIPAVLPPTGAGAGRGNVSAVTVNKTTGNKQQVVPTKTPESRLSDITRYVIENTPAY